MIEVQFNKLVPDQSYYFKYKTNIATISNKRIGTFVGVKEDNRVYFKNIRRVHPHYKDMPLHEEALCNINHIGNYTFYQDTRNAVNHRNEQKAVNEIISNITSKSIEHWPTESIDLSKPYTYGKGKLKPSKMKPSKSKSSKKSKLGKKWKTKRYLR